MALSEKDEKQLLQWFEEKQKHSIDSDEYYKYRDLIFTSALRKLNDYFFALKKKWATKYRISSEDCISIIHDGLLKASNTFDPNFHKSSKFITYLTKILNNLALNYFHRDNFTQKRLKHDIHQTPAAAYVSLDHLLSMIDGIDETEPVAPVFRELVHYLSLQTEYFDSSFNERFFIEQFLERLSDSDKFILQSVLDGYSLSEVAKRLNLSIPGVRYKLQLLAKQMRELENL